MAARASCIMGQSVCRPQLSKVGMSGAEVGMGIPSSRQRLTTGVVVQAC